MTHSLIISSTPTVIVNPQQNAQSTTLNRSSRIQDTILLHFLVFPVPIPTQHRYLQLCALYSKCFINYNVHLFISTAYLTCADIPACTRSSAPHSAHWTPPRPTAYADNRSRAPPPHWARWPTFFYPRSSVHLRLSRSHSASP